MSEAEERLSDRVLPKTLNLIRDQELRISWADGVESRIALPALRGACPCATCRALREERRRNPLAVLPRAADESTFRAESASLAGRYALRIVWADGHDTGIYDFPLLRRLSDADERQEKE